MIRIAVIMNVVITLAGVTSNHVQYRRCKWSNEDCVKDSDCCSDECYLAHEGTDPRCARGTVGFPCYADYQCESGLDCGSKYKCCAPYWGICSHINQCCDKSHVCREEQGFSYRRCLYPNEAPRIRGSNIAILCISVSTLLFLNIDLYHSLLMHFSNFSLFALIFPS
ncbi:hypothetical protein KP79_PYT23120 [Mizuhopecten yessoensis]|uniref:Granulin n=1 Tax=Mizuhopecten yessoensis TaxID=6573 RepID=A0A210QNH2_MIZYE|nr:hypothetical protein KP79_PYT23120 [Mizuhopecten yessoensis]